MKLIPRLYQETAINSFFEWSAVQFGHYIISMPTGSGKALVLCETIRRAIANHPPTRILQLTHVQELLQQNYDELLGLWPEAPVGLYSAGLNKRQIHKQITIASIQSIYKKGHLLNWIDLCIIDECFTGDTLISTPIGKKRIDQLCKGDTILNACGLGTVYSIYKATAKTLIHMELSNGTRIECTADHPFFTKNGWKSAALLESGENVFSQEDLLALWQRVYPMDKKRRKWQDNKCLSRADMEQSKILLNILLKETCEPNERQCSANENEGHITKDKASSNKTRREREVIATSAIGAFARFRRGVDGRSRNQDECGSFKRRISQLLQNRYSKYRPNDWNRSKWENTLRRTGSARQEKIGFLSGVRVENIIHIERESPEPIFNLRVTGHPSYFANGILVHNCHLLSPKATTMYQKLLNTLRKVNPDLRIMGLSATPWRSADGHLVSEGGIFTDVCYDISMKDLIQQGYLSPLVSKGSEIKADMKGVKVTGGDYNIASMAERFDQETLTKAAISEICEIGKDRKKWLIFCCNVTHAYHVRDEFRKNGISCEAVSGDMDKKERARVLESFKNGDLQCVTNFGVLTTGFNNPKIDLIALLRATKSSSLYCQILGRGSRLSPHKKDCKILDYGGNLERHGPVDKITVEIKTDKSGKKKCEIHVMPTKVCPNCFSPVHTRSLECGDCGFVFPAEDSAKHERKASTKNVISDDPKWFDVKSVKYYKHEKQGKPNMVKAIYFCGMNRFTDYFCLWHGGYAQTKAIAKWASRGGAIPKDINEALGMVDSLKAPKKILVDVDNKYPEIKKYEY